MNIVNILGVFKMNELLVKTSTHNYSVYIEKGIRHRLKEFLPKKYSSILIVTDDTISKLYLKDVEQALAGERVYRAIIPAGEGSKNIEQYYRLQTIAMENNLDRKALIIALGGGVVGDLAGFVAATFMRGIDYIQLPTTILAHDSSVGGKVAINHELGKNMIGSFYPPRAVIYDVEVLESLPDHEVRSGYAEIVKEAYIANVDLLESLLTCQINEATSHELNNHLFEGIKIKANIVEQDEKESHVRKFLNFGHTLAHALEAELGYGVITHGEAVAIGMIFALDVSEKYYNVSLKKDTYVNWLKNNHYPLSLYDIKLERIIEKMKLDKKAVNKTIQMVLLREIGLPEVVDFTDDEIYAYLEQFVKEMKET